MNWNNSQSQRPTFTSTPLTTVLNFLWTNLPLVKHHVRILSLVFYLWKWLFYTYFSFNPLWNYHFILKKNKVPILPFYYYYLNPHFIRTILSLSFLALAPRNCDPHCNSHWISLSLSLLSALLLQWHLKAQKLGTQSRYSTPNTMVEIAVESWRGHQWQADLGGLVGVYPLWVWFVWGSLLWA